MTKEIVLKLFEIEDQERALEAFYHHFGPSVRSEYTLDDSFIVDLDWETSGCVITFVDGVLDQIRLIVYHELGHTFKG